MSMSPLHLAAVHRDADEVLRLLESGADPGSLNKSKRMPIHCALGLPCLHPADAKEKAEKVFRILWKAAPGSVLESTNCGETVLFDMVLGNYDELIKDFVAEHPNMVSKRNNFGQCAIHAGVLNGCDSALKILFTTEGVAKLTGRKGRTIMHFAVEGGGTRMTKLCFDYYPESLDICDHEGSTPLGLAARHNKPLAKYLRELGATKKWYGGTRCSTEPDDDEEEEETYHTGAGGGEVVGSDAAVSTQPGEKTDTRPGAQLEADAIPSVDPEETHQTSGGKCVVS